MKKPNRRPIYFVVRKMADPDTGEMVGCLVPDSGLDRRAMRDRKYTVGTQLRAELKKPRNVKFHRLAHAIGGLMVDNVESFSNLDAHSAVSNGAKALREQKQANLCKQRGHVYRLRKSRRWRTLPLDHHPARRLTMCTQAAPVSTQRLHVQIHSRGTHRGSTFAQEARELHLVQVTGQSTELREASQGTCVELHRARRTPEQEQPVNEACERSLPVVRKRYHELTELSGLPNPPETAAPCGPKEPSVRILHNTQCHHITGRALPDEPRRLLICRVVVTDLARLTRLPQWGSQR